MARDPVLNALEELQDVLAANAERARLIEQRIAHIRDQRAAGLSYSEIVPGERTPLVVQLVSECAVSLDRVGSRLRRAEARKLYDEGVTMERIAALFGVTRQRVATLLKVTNGG